jgi:hypothetical protein
MNNIDWVEFRDASTFGATQKLNAWLSNRTHLKIISVSEARINASRICLQVWYVLNPLDMVEDYDRPAKLCEQQAKDLSETNALYYSARDEIAEKDRKLAEFQAVMQVYFGACVPQETELASCEAASFEQGRKAGIYETELKYSQMDVAGWFVFNDFGGWQMLSKEVWGKTDIEGIENMVALIVRPPTPTKEG